MDPTDLKSLHSYFEIPENITAEELKFLEHFTRNVSRNAENYDVSVGILALLIILYGSISLIAILGNSLVIFVVMRKRNMQTITNVFIANLAFADVAIGMFTIPFQFHAALLQRWVLAEFMCKVAPFVKNLSVNVSILTLTVIAFDRYIAVMYPLKAGIRKRVAISVLCTIWVISTISSVPDVIYHDTQTIFDIKIWTKNVICHVNWPSHTFKTCYFCYLFLLQYLVPLVVISFSYIRVSHRIWGSKPPGNEMAARDEMRSTHKKKVVKMLIIVVSLFALCWLPLQAYNFTSAVYPDINEFKYINIIWFCSNWLAMSNSCYNPFIYGLLNEKFKREFKQLIRMCTCRRHSQRQRTGRYFVYNNSYEKNQKKGFLDHGSQISHLPRCSRNQRRSVNSSPGVQSTSF